MGSHPHPGTTLERTQEQSQHRPFIANGHTARIPVQDGAEAEEVPPATAAVIVDTVAAEALAATVAVIVVVVDIVVAAVAEAASTAEVAAEAVLPHRVVEAPAAAEAEEVTEW